MIPQGKTAIGARKYLPPTAGRKFRQEGAPWKPNPDRKRLSQLPRLKHTGEVEAEKGGNGTPSRSQTNHQSFVFHGIGRKILSVAR